MDKDIQYYIKSLELEHLDWAEPEDEADSKYEITALLIVEYEGGKDRQLQLKLGKGDLQTGWMEADDLGWVGPVRNVVAWAKVDI